MRFIIERKASLAQVFIVAYRLVNQRDGNRNIKINSQTWYGILELAEDYGWSPLGTVLPERYGLAGFYRGDPDQWYGDYWSEGSRLVLIEDALNLADALNEAYLDYEPIHAPTLHSYFDGNGFAFLDRPQPSMGAITLVVDLCQQGAFFIEKA
jgi:hypothetical protein